MSAIVPTPYRSVTVIKVATGPSPASDAPDPVDGDQLHALVAVTAIASDSQKISLTYALLLTLRAGRWEITGLDPAPLRQPATSNPGALPAPGNHSPTPSSSSITTSPS